MYVARSSLNQALYVLRKKRGKQPLIKLIVLPMEALIPASRQLDTGHLLYSPMNVPFSNAEDILFFAVHVSVFAL